MKTIGLKVGKTASKAPKKAKEKKGEPVSEAPKDEAASAVKKKGEKPSEGEPVSEAPKDEGEQKGPDAS